PVICPERIEPLRRRVSAQVDIDTLLPELTLQSPLPKSALGNTSTVKTVHAVCSHNALLCPSNATVLHEGVTELLQSALHSIDKPTHILKLHPTALIMEVKPL